MKRAGKILLIVVIFGLAILMIRAIVAVAILAIIGCAIWIWFDK